MSTPPALGPISARIGWVGGAATRRPDGYRGRVVTLLGLPPALAQVSPLVAWDGAGSALAAHVAGRLLGPGRAVVWVVELAAGDAEARHPPEVAGAFLEEVLAGLRQGGAGAVVVAIPPHDAGAAEVFPAVAAAHEVAAFRAGAPFVDGRALAGDAEALERATAAALRKVLGRPVEAATPAGGALPRRELVAMDAGAMAEAPERCAGGHVVVQHRSLVVGAGDALAWSTPDELNGLLVVAGREASRVELAGERGAVVRDVPASASGPRAHAVLLGPKDGPAHQLRVRVVDAVGAPSASARLEALGWLVTHTAVGAAPSDDD